LSVLHEAGIARRVPKLIIPVTFRLATISSKKLLGLMSFSGSWIHVHNSFPAVQLFVGCPLAIGILERLEISPTITRQAVIVVAGLDSQIFCLALGTIQKRKIAASSIKYDFGLSGRRSEVS
jgi:hypothetical protein